jgi:hypothetical protein
MSRHKPQNPDHLPPPAWFSEWWEPAEFFEAVYRHNGGVPAVDFFARDQLKPLREAYAAGFFSLILAQQGWPIAVRLDSERFPDFQLRQGDEVVPYELVEAYPPGERRGDEYKEAARRKAEGLPEVLKEFDPEAEERAAIPVIVAAVKNKADKGYNPPPCLLVYVNFWLFREPPLSAMEFAERLRPWVEKFRAVWLLWGSNAIRCHPDPERFHARSLPAWLIV